MTTITLFWSAIVERLQRRHPSYLVVSGSFVPAIEHYVLKPWDPIAQDAGTQRFHPKTDPERLTNDSDAVIEYEYSFAFRDNARHTWDVVYGVDWAQVDNKMNLPSMVAGAPAVELTLRETKPVVVEDIKLPYTGKRKISIGPRTAIMVTAGVSAMSPSARWRGELRLAGGLTYTLQRPNGELLTPTRPVPLDNFFAGDPHPQVAIHGPGIVGINVEVTYVGYIPAERPDVVVGPAISLDAGP